MRSSALPLVGLALIIAGGIAFGVYFFVTESSAPKPRNSTDSARDEKPKPAPKPAPETRAEPAPETPQPGDEAAVKTVPREDTTPKPADPPVEPADATFRVTISGRVLDEAGQGLPGIDVVATILADAKSNIDRRKEDSADDTPAGFTTTSVLDGKYSLEIAHNPNGKQQTIKVRMTVTTIGWTLPTEVVHDGLRAGMTKTVDLRVVPAGSATGRVVDSQGNPQPEMTISAEHIANAEQGLASPRKPGRVAVTDTSGQFRFDGLLVGTWQFSLVAKAGTKSANRVSAAITAGAESTLEDIVVVEPASIRFRAVDTDGNPLPADLREAGLTLTFLLPDGTKVAVQAHPEDNGTTLCNNVPSTATEMLVSHARLSATETVALSLKGGEEADLGDVRLTLKPTDAEGTPDGSVPGEDGK
jgi:protocatechuate 3,4-dioxygenase beta subunit